MLKFILFNIFFMICFFSYAQNGLEDIIVEKYYISDINDFNNTAGGVLPIKSTTYRIYVDMLPGYIFQAAYGIPDHELRIETTTKFFNNEDRGATTPKYTRNQAKNNTVMLDSWLSVGAALNGEFGVMKSDDDGVNTIVNKDGILKNNDPQAGIPLTVQDGFLEGIPEDVTFLGLSSQLSVFDSETNGNIFQTTDGSWACLNGATGPDSVSNKVLIAQITTDGELSFELNVQIRSKDFNIERYVAKNPGLDERTIPSLTRLISSVEESIKNKIMTVQVYPTVANDYINIEIKNANSEKPGGQVSLINANGMNVYQEQFDNFSELHKINISHLASGLYILILQHSGHTESKKFIKM